MNRRKFLRNMAVSGVAVATLRLGLQGNTFAAATKGEKKPLKRRVTHTDRKAAAKNAKAAGLTPGILAVNTLAPTPGGVPDYFGPFPNYANSPIIRKFVDSLPGLGSPGQNNLGKYIPVAVPDTITYPGSDYYEIDLVEFDERFHSDLQMTKVRGYVQHNGGDPIPHYLGPIIVAQRDRPVRVKFTNKLPAGGDLFLPVDTTVMGAGTGPTGSNYSQNRATLHLHGGNTPWISDGTAHQWTTPVNESTAYPKGVSVQNVPDMPTAGPGELTFFYTNQQSARLMFYHDHAYGITRLNVYAGEAAGYILADDFETQLVNAGTIPADQIPLIIQDKTFLDPANVLKSQDPTWPFAVDVARNDLWFPHVYMPNQNPYDISGANAMGRWDYGPWFWPPFSGITYGEIANPYYDPTNAPWEPPTIPGTPNASIVPEAFMDTPIVNGQAYPYLEVQPKAYRFRILNACNDRSINLQLYKAANTTDAMWNPDGTLANAAAGEVAMVPAVPRSLPDVWPTGWPTPDGRAGGFPDPNAVGPQFIQIGTEGGLLPAPVVIQNRPIGYNYNRRDVVVLNVQETALFLGPAERADVIVDFSAFAGQTLILYNDSPAPVPAFDPRYDYYTGDEDQTLTGGAPTTAPGYGPNTRTIMQIRVANVTSAAAFDLAALQAALPGIFAKSQDQIIVPNAVYNTVYGAQYPVDSYSRIESTSLTVFNGVIAKLSLTNGGSDYTVAPVVSFDGGSPTTPATAQASLTPTSLASINFSNNGAGYTAAPTVSFSGGGGSGAAATAALTPTSVAGITLTNGGRNYKTAPTVVIGPPQVASGQQATATALISKGGVVTTVTINNPGSGYTAAPTVSFSGSSGSGATATSRLTPTSLASLTLTKGGTGYTAAPTVNFSGGGGSGAAATAALTPTSVAAVTLTSGGLGYMAVPGVVFTPADGAGGGAAATASIGVNIGMQPKAIQELFDPEYGRMNAILGCEIANTNIINQTTIPYYFIDPPNELIKASDLTQPVGSAADGTQLWKITHNGVDTHAIHFHLFNVQLVNRVGWDGAIRPPEANELGWKETVRMNPLEDCIVALRAYKQNLPWDIPDNIRPLNVTMPIGSAFGFTNVDPSGQPATVTNQNVNFGWEYTWHCHLLGHEENDMMRPIIFGVTPKAPDKLVGTVTKGAISLAWVKNPSNSTNFTVRRATSANGPWTTLKTVPVSVTSYTDKTVSKGKTYWYQVIANNVYGYTQPYAAPAVGYANMSMDSTPSTVGPVTAL